jgi:hypothetical protein
MIPKNGLEMNYSPHKCHHADVKILRWTRRRRQQTREGGGWGGVEGGGDALHA